MCNRLRPAQPNLFLDSGDGYYFNLVVPEGAECFQHDVHAGAVVQALSGNVVSNVLEGAVQRDHVPDLNLGLHGLGWQTKIHEEFLNLWGFGFLTPHEMDWLALWHEKATQLLTVTGGHGDPLGNKVSRVETTDWLQAKKALLVDVTHQEPNLVHVRRDQHAPQRGTRHLVTARMPNANCIADCVNANFIDQRPHCLNDDLTDCFLT